MLLAQLLLAMTGVEGMSAAEQVGVMAVGTRLFGPYVLAVELASILLLAGLVSAYHLARQIRAEDE